MVARETQSERTDIISEIAGTGTIPSRCADVIIKANIKTHLEGYYILEPKDIRGKPGYPFLINIDGQVKPAYDKDDGKIRDPEAGEGMKYVLEKKIRFAVGPNKVFFGLPEESYYRTTDITVEDGRLYVLEFKPHYRYKPKPASPTFLKGISNYEVLLKEIDVRVR